MTGLMRSGCARIAQMGNEITDARGANLAIRSRVAESSLGVEVFKSKGLPVGDKQVGY
jgi:hypothetical protein